MSNDQGFRQMVKAFAEGQVDVVMMHIDTTRLLTPDEWDSSRRQEPLSSSSTSHFPTTRLNRRSTTGPRTRGVIRSRSMCQTRHFLTLAPVPKADAGLSTLEQCPRTPVGSWLQFAHSDPPVDQPGVLARADVTAQPAAAGKQPIVSPSSAPLQPRSESLSRRIRNLERHGPACLLLNHR